MYCQKCGKEIDGKFCGYCGEKVFEKTQVRSENNQSFCYSCEIYSEGDYCKACGKLNRKNNVINKQNRLANFFVGFAIFIMGTICFTVFLSGIYSDLDSEYNYRLPLTSHEITNIFVVCIGIIAILIGIMMLTSNKREAECSSKAVLPLSYISYGMLVLSLLWSFFAAIPYMHACDRCGKPFFGKAYTDFWEEQVFCYDCDQEYWSW